MLRDDDIRNGGIVVKRESWFSYITRHGPDTIFLIGNLYIHQYTYFIQIV